MADSTGRQSSKTFYWTGIRPDGTRVKNERIVAALQEQVVSALMREGIFPTKVSGGDGMNLNMSIGGGEVKFKYAAKADFARRLYQLLRAGVSVPKSLESMGQDAKPEIADMCQKLADGVSSGESLAAAMAEFPKAFDDVFISYVGAGEEAGTLLVSLERLSVLLAKRAAMQSKIKGVMAYPKMVGGTILLLTFGIIMFLVPRFVDIYTSFGADLPAPTLMMVAFSKNMLPITGMETTESWIKIPLFLFGLAFNPVSILMLALYAFFGWRFFRKKTADNQDVNIFLNKITFKMPVLGQLNHKSALFRWSSTLAGSLTAGVQSSRALEMAAASSGSKWIEALTPGMIDAVRSGRTIASEMSQYPDVFPTNIRTMVTTGEGTGELDSMLESVSEALDQEVDSIVEGLSAKIEVVLLLVLGLVVGGLLMVLYMPILQLASTASKGMSGGG